MALSNAERQARYKARLREQAAAGLGLRAAILDFMAQNPEAAGDAPSPEIMAGYLMAPLEKPRLALQSTVEAWREGFPDADFSRLDAALRALE